MIRLTGATEHNALHDLPVFLTVLACHRLQLLMNINSMLVNLRSMSWRAAA